MHCSNTELVPLTGLILQMRKRRNTVERLLYQDHSLQAIEQDLKSSNLTLNPVLSTTSRRVQFNSLLWSIG